MQELGAATPEGRKRRAALQMALESTQHEFSAIGIEMNQDYTASPAVCQDTSNSAPTAAVLSANPDPVLHHTRSTVPGWRLPHVWLTSAIPGKPVSTIELAGKGGFTLFTGIGGEAWKKAAVKVSASLDVPIRAVSIGWDQDYEDTYSGWTAIRGVDESGIVLVRPDRFVAWRHESMEGDDEWAAGKLLVAMKKVLALDE